MRRAPGAELRAFNATDGEFAAELTAIRKDRGAMRLGARLRAPSPEPELRALIAALKREAMDWAVEKAAELGATVIQPVLTRHCVADRSNTLRLAGIARAAAEQCERLSVPGRRGVAPAACRARRLGRRAAAGRRRAPRRPAAARRAGGPAGALWLSGRSRGGL
ncbi:RsmE family RNA methyltransferase [Roseococcus sp.]|uniref:RsmE family RNA methyltransferase n=1 Tax=Roseococcus sp. TaxID=2109646 RepID=UPI003BAAB6AC